jgi:hypothetical protein
MNGLYSLTVHPIDCASWRALYVLYLILSDPFTFPDSPPVAKTIFLHL